MKKLAKFLLGRDRGEAALEPKLLLFDFDGTIADTFEAGFDILNTLAPEFGFRALKKTDLETARDMRLSELIKFLKIRPTKIAKIARRAAEELSARIHEIGPLPEMIPIIKELQQRGYRLGILTSNSPENVGIFLKNHDFQVFDFIRSSSKLMGKAREIKAIRKILRLQRSEILLIGDECRDIEAAHRAGVAIVALAGGYNSQRALAATKPQFLLEQPSDLLKLLPESGVVRPLLE